LFIFRFELGDAYLGAVSRFMTNAFEYGDSLLEEKLQREGVKVDATAAGSTNQPYLNLPTFRMVVLADELLESFFDSDLSASFRLDTEPAAAIPQTPAGLLGGLMSTLMTEDNKKMFIRVADEIGKTMGKHHVDHRPSIGKIGRDVAMQEPKARESLLHKTPSPRSLSSGSGLPQSAGSTVHEKDLGTTSGPESASLHASTPVVEPLSPSPLIPTPMIMERRAFAIDEAKDDGREEGMYAIGGDDDDDEMMDEVDAFLEENEKGLTDAQIAEAKDLLSASPQK